MTSEAVKEFHHIVIAYKKESEIRGKKATLEEINNRLMTWIQTYAGNEQAYLKTREDLKLYFNDDKSSRDFITNLTQENKFTEFMPKKYNKFQKNVSKANEVKLEEKLEDITEATANQIESLEVLNKKIIQIDKRLNMLSEEKSAKSKQIINTITKLSEEFKNEYKVKLSQKNNTETFSFVLEWKSKFKEIEETISNLELSSIQNNLNNINYLMDKIRDPENLSLKDFNYIDEMRKNLNSAKEILNGSETLKKNLTYHEIINHYKNIVASLEEKIVQQKKAVSEQQPKIDALFDQLKARRNEAEDKMPDALKGLITRGDYHHILNYIIDNRAALEIELAKGPYHLARDKFSESRKKYIDGADISRSVNFIIDPKTGDFQLILETKSKIVDEHGLTIKNPNPQVFSGAFKSTKAAYRIDTPAPIKMANAVFYATKKGKEKEKQLAEAKTEALLSQKAVEGLGEERKFINVTSLGQLRDDTGVRGTNNIPYFAKQSHYSEFAECGDLDNVLKNPEKFPLTKKDKNDIAQSILKAVEILHNKNIVHQDIKPANILIYKDEKGEYYAALSDYGLSHAQGIKEKGIAGTPIYLSPEMFAARPDLVNSFQNAISSIPGLKIYQEHKGQYSASEQYKVPNVKNDMWAVGLVLNEIYYRNVSPYGDLDNEINLISTLLKNEREARSSASEAISHLQPLIEYENTINNVANEFLTKLKNQTIRKSYTKNRDKNDGMFFKFAKDAGNSIFNTAEKRSLQIDVICDAAIRIKKDNTLSGEEKLQLMHSVLTKVESDIKSKEFNAFSSGMAKTCQELKKEILVIAKNADATIDRTHSLENSLTQIGKKKGNYKKMLNTLEIKSELKQKKPLKPI